MRRRIIKNTVVHYSNKDLLIQSSGRYITIYQNDCQKKVSIKLPYRFPRDFHFNIPLFKRFLRSDAKEVIYDNIGSRLIIIRNSSVYLVEENDYKVLGVIEGDAPLFNSHCIHDGDIYFGQYDRNEKRNESRIYKIDRTNKLVIAHTFSAGQIRHVHSITLDTFDSNRMWITTGDNDNECLLMYTDDKFKSVTNIGDKSQEYRIVSLGFSKDYLFYGTDNLTKENYLYRQRKSDEKRHRVLAIKQTAWFLKQDNHGGAVLGTTVENGKGCQVNYSSIFFSTDYGLTWLEILRIPKDIYPMPMFKWGSVSFSNSPDSLDDLYINVEGLKDLSGYSINLGYLINFSESDLRKIEVKKRAYFTNKADLMLVIYRLFLVYQNSNDIRYLNLLLKSIDWLPIHMILQKIKLRTEALKLYANINNSPN
tara:strand:+ start:14480 stop:15745 length:1266 start_codon:yes stop_codon:yes gene_type:complete